MGVAGKLNGIACYQVAKRSGVEKQLIDTYTGAVENSPAPICYFTCESDSGTGTTITDDSESTNAHNASMSGSTWYSADPAFGSYSVATSNGNTTTVADHADLDLDYNDPWTLSIYIKHTGTDYAGLYVKRDTGAGDYRGIAVFIFGGKLQIYIVNTWGTVGVDDASILVVGTTAINDDAWNHVVITYDGSTNASGVTATINGSGETLSVSGGHDTLGNDTTTNAVAAALGNASDTSAFELGGWDELALFPVELTSGQITTLYNSGSAIDVSRGL